MTDGANSVVLVHVTDPHFGAEQDPKNVRFIPGWREHDFRLCLHLPQVVGDARILTGVSDNEPIYFVMTGDLTATGASGEFDTGRNYFLSQWRIGRRRSGYLGLNLSPAEYRSIPGNHDHWKGIRRWPPPAYNPRIFGAYFEQTPWTGALPSPSGRLRVELFGIDSCSGNSAFSYDPLAEGCISRKEFTQLELDLGASIDQSPMNTGVNVVRAILCHHSFTCAKLFSLTQALQNASVSRLLALALDYDVRAILTGHTHTFKIKPYSLGSGSNRLVSEVRSPTTLKGPAKPRSRQGLWVHKISCPEGSSKPVWEAWPFMWNGAQFANLSSQFTLDKVTP